MQPSDFTHFITDAGEKIQIHTCVDKRPFLCGFEDPPEGALWQDLSSSDICDTRFFTMPTAPGASVIFDVNFRAQIADNDPDPKATYTVTVSGSGGGQPSISSVVVPRGTIFPITETFVFQVAR